MKIIFCPMSDLRGNKEINGTEVKTSAYLLQSLSRWVKRKGILHLFYKTEKGKESFLYIKKFLFLCFLFPFFWTRYLLGIGRTKTFGYIWRIVWDQRSKPRKAKALARGLFLFGWIRETRFLKYGTVILSYQSLSFLCAFINLLL